ncbi:MAG: ABC transporter permease [Desulfobacterales bacterium]|nr:ABC transporter permease [Desulfobacterales bacterium]MDD4073299.1 ABC transporter permease [Desulfobacterales bacterium]MDD4393504.1 ABC transporter permease [Desulfobacterales bacterium]
MSLFSQFKYFLFDLYRNRSLIAQLTLKDFSARYFGSYLGILWPFIHPTATVMVIWFVFQIGFKSVPVADCPFVLWLVVGIVPWLFISEALSGATGAITEYAFLVKKIVFRVSILPVVKLLSALIIHLFFILVLFVMSYLYGYEVSLYNLQIIYYLPATVLLLLGISCITSSMVVFLKDVGQMVAICLQFGFWLTPIFWSIDMIPEKYHFLIKMNPAYYIVNGYRETFIYKQWFWEHAAYALYFWSVALCTFIIGALIFSRLRPHFADVL